MAHIHIYHKDEDPPQFFTTQDIIIIPNKDGVTFIIDSVHTIIRLRFTWQEYAATWFKTLNYLTHHDPEGG